jgi:hypothetical protein
MEGDDRDDLLGKLTLNSLQQKKISKYFPDIPADECVYVIVKQPASTTVSRCEQELLDQVASLKALLNKSVHGMYSFLTWGKRNFRL